MSQAVDLFVIGGGVNGCGIARDAAGRGLRVRLAEMGDLAQATSSASTKLFHGGLRYLEYLEIKLVREALSEREVLIRAMPHISWPMRFVLPYSADMRFESDTPVSKMLSTVMPWMRGKRPSWMIRSGLFLYDHLGGQGLLPGTKRLDLRNTPEGAPLKDQFAHAFEYSDGWVQDARLVVLNARDAEAHGADIRVQTRVVEAHRDGGHWVIATEGPNGREEHLARAVVNAGGPWVEQILKGTMGSASREHIRLVRGSHIVTRKLYDHDKCYFFQGTDGRIIFAIPYEQEFTLIGTTEAAHEDSPLAAECTEAERDYLCEFASEYFKQEVTPDDVVWTYSGVRPLYEDGASSATAATREYVLSLDAPTGQPAALHVFGGKITTYRRLAEDALAKLRPHLPGMGGPWTKDARLPGGDFAPEEVEAKIAKLSQDYPFVDRKWAERMIRHYGTEAWDIFGDAKALADLGRDFGGTLTEAELRWLVEKEWARKVEDVIWRRTKLGLRLDADQVNSVAAWLEEHAA
ncbi:glycerol-3-phosphate dehydrogenase [Thioclava sp. F1Mire-8]|uniref:glycerol-3-phosphate dehydrogenase n=1 Tax=Thioclava sp. F1Mire-8 TaxID=1973006 RepID=UPI000B5435E6|nr:glycerol-3-phosphate dehydrogenase [Thioclava sp. F1Mire-8]OWX99375.1 glycerol-3-phosphate dehydrogenase [Thioclava sp. F1Mire-8]